MNPFDRDFPWPFKQLPAVALQGTSQPLHKAVTNRALARLVGAGRIGEVSRKARETGFTEPPSDVPRVLEVPFGGFVAHLVNLGGREEADGSIELCCVVVTPADGEVQGACVPVRVDKAMERVLSVAGPWTRGVGTGPDAWGAAGFEWGSADGDGLPSPAAYLTGGLVRRGLGLTEEEAADAEVVFRLAASMDREIPGEKVCATMADSGYDELWRLAKEEAARRQARLWVCLEALVSPERPEGRVPAWASADVRAADLTRRLWDATATVVRARHSFLHPGRLMTADNLRSMLARPLGEVADELDLDLDRLVETVNTLAKLA